MVLKKFEEFDMEILDFDVPRSYECVAFSLREIMNQYAHRVEEVVMDSTCKHQVTSITLLFSQ